MKFIETLKNVWKLKFWGPAGVLLEWRFSGRRIEKFEAAGMRNFRMREGAAGMKILECQKGVAGMA